MRIKTGIIQTFIQGLLRSYSQIFFSESYWFAIPLVIVSFLDISAGLCGLLSVFTANLAATSLKFDKLSASKGYYGFNSLLVGLGLGYHYELTAIILVTAIFAGFLTFLITIAFQGILGKYYLPYLSIPFVFSIWIVLSAGGMLNDTQVNHSGVYVLNTLFSIGGNNFVDFHHWWGKNITSGFLNSYFLSLGAIFFQFNVLAGFVVAVALLFYSRIAFLLSLIGYGVAYLAYSYMGMDMTSLGYSYIGFNFILGAIAIGGYFYIPSKQSFFWAFAITPVVALVAAGLSGLLKPLNLSIYSLPFNLIVLVFIYTFRFRAERRKLIEVQIQEGTPERNLYSFESFTRRFPNFGWLQMRLPFFGEWHVSQGHDGEHTHKGEWRHAWDFVITDSELSQFSDSGSLLTDYYCFGKNVLSPAAGTVVVAEDGIDDNMPGEVNTLKNWGNTIIIKHGEGLYSKVSHLMKGSVLVHPGDNVSSGQIVGKAGNSGRSPYPHLHFQIQATPYIGSATIKYPLFAYIENGLEIKTFSYPSEGQIVKSVEENAVLKKAFNLMPGTKLNWKVKTKEALESVNWEVFTTVYNKSYIYCHKTRSIAYFQYDGVFFCFTHFSGSKKSLLYQFYQTAFRIPVICVDGYTIADSLPVNMVFSGLRLFIHDFTAPFFMYIKVGFVVTMNRIGSEFDLKSITYNSRLSGYSFSKKMWDQQLKLTVNSDNSLVLVNGSTKTEALCESY